MFIENPPLSELMHYGIKKRSGRYPWGSGDNPYQHSGDWLSRVEELEDSGFKPKDIAEGLGIDVGELELARRVALHERRELTIDKIKSLKSDGYNNSEIGRKLGINESQVRALLKENANSKGKLAQATANKLKEALNEHDMIDVGKGVNLGLGISEDTFEEAVYMVENQDGYKRLPVLVPQATDSTKKTTTVVLCKDTIPDEKYIQAHIGEVYSVDNEYRSTDGGEKWYKREYPSSISSDRVAIRYGDEGGTNKDGVIEIRRGVDDLDLGNSHYAQVRILVDGTHYLKGMAIYSDNVPEGSDILFNTNKKSGTDKMDILKKIESDPDNPFGAMIKANGQSHYLDKDGNEKLSAINKVNDEGDFDTSSSRNLSSQFLSKQPEKLIRRQLDMTYADKVAEFDEIMSYTNPTIKKKLLKEFSDECDKAAITLQAAALPRQKRQVILPVDDLKETEVFAPNFRNGEKVALIRYPHAGLFEIPILTVNNKNESAVKNIGLDVTDAVGINSKVAERLSGADFDGDTVIVIPTHNRSGIKIQNKPPLKDLEGFDPKSAYPYREGMKVLGKKAKQTEMGKISNLITDMTLHDAPDEEIARAVKHSMVVIDAEKHKLDYKRSEKENGIKELKEKYQRHTVTENDVDRDSTGASTLISRHKHTADIPETKGTPSIDPLTGKYIPKYSGRKYYKTKKDKTTGEKIKTDILVEAKSKMPLLLYVDDAHKLSSGTVQENLYANHVNKMKALANTARKEHISAGDIKYSASANKTYKKEVDHLLSQLNIAQRNAPLERRAQRIANSVIRAKEQENPDVKYDKKERNKIAQYAIADARVKVGASGKETRIRFSDREWEAIQAGAISKTKLVQILSYADPNEYRKRALPKATTQLSDAKISKIKAMRNSGYTNQEIADALGCSTSTVSGYLKEAT